MISPRFTALMLAVALAWTCLPLLGADTQTTKPATKPATAPAATKPETIAPKVPLTYDEIKKSVDSGEYRSALEGISRLLSPSHPVDYDRPDVLMLRAECYLQLKQNIQATDCLDGIRKQAHQDAARKDESQAAAMIFLIRKSPGYKYTPKTGDDKIPIDILDRVKRTRAYLELYIDELAVTQQIAKEAAFGSSLIPIIKVCDELYSVQAVERINTGAIKQTSDVAQQLCKSAKNIITTAENDFNAQIVRISRYSNNMVVVQNGLTVQNGRARQNLGGARRGVTVPDQHALADIIVQCDKIREVINTLRQLSDQPEALAVLYDRAAELKGNAQEELANR